MKRQKAIFLSILIILMTVYIALWCVMVSNGCKCEKHIARMYFNGKTTMMVSDCVKWECKDKK